MVSYFWKVLQFLSENTVAFYVRLHIDKLKRVMPESLPDKVLKDIDSRSASKPAAVGETP